MHKAQCLSLSILKRSGCLPQKEKECCSPCSTNRRYQLTYKYTVRSYDTKQEVCFYRFSFWYTTGLKDQLRYLFLSMLSLYRLIYSVEMPSRQADIRVSYKYRAH